MNAAEDQPLAAKPGVGELLTDGLDDEELGTASEGERLRGSHGVFVGRIRQRPTSEGLAFQSVQREKAHVTRRDRRDGAWLGLMLLAFGLLIAPLLHGVDHGHAHSHGPSQARHGDSSLEHQSLAFASPAVVNEPTFFAVALGAPVSTSQQWPALTPRWTAEQPQGP